MNTSKTISPAIINVGRINDRHELTVMRSRFNVATFITSDVTTLDEYDMPNVIRIEESLCGALRGITVTVSRCLLDEVVRRALADLGFAS